MKALIDQNLSVRLVDIPAAGLSLNHPLTRRRALRTVAAGHAKSKSDRTLARSLSGSARVSGRSGTTTVFWSTTRTTRPFLAYAYRRRRCRK